MTELAKQIFELRELGKSYRQIANELKCSKGTICYYLGVNQKNKTGYRRDINRLKLHPYVRKLENFKYGKYKKCNKIVGFINNDKVLLYKKITVFFGAYKKDKNMITTFTIEDVINKFGKNPKCYLTGEDIDIYKPRTYHFDHIIPRSRGGQDNLDNLGICSKRANLAKSDMTPDEFINLCKIILEHNGYQIKKTEIVDSND